MSFSKLVGKQLPSLSASELQTIQVLFDEEINKKTGKPRGGLTGYHMFLRHAKEQGTSHADALAVWQDMTQEEKKEFKVDPEAVQETKKKGTSAYKEFTAKWREEEKKKQESGKLPQGWMKMQADAWNAYKKELE